MAKSKKTAGGKGGKSVLKRDRLAGRVIRRATCMQTVAQAVGEITPGCEIYGLTKGQWSLIDLIEHCLAASGPADVVLSTWTAANADIGFARSILVNGGIRSLRFVVDFSFPSRQPEYCAALREAFGDDAIRITKNHAKFVLIRNAEWDLVVRTSMNLNENRRLENFEVSDCKPMAEFLTEVVDDLFREQSAAEAFERRPSQHEVAFETQWGEAGPPEAAAAAAGSDPNVKQYFGDGPLSADLRRVGVAYF